MLCSLAVQDRAIVALPRKPDRLSHLRAFSFSSQTLKSAAVVLSNAYPSSTVFKQVLDNMQTAASVLLELAG